MQYADSNSIVYIPVNQGLQNKVSVTPYKFAVTSSPQQQSAIWIGRFGPLEIRQTFQLDNTALFFTTTVSIKNVDVGPVSRIFCEPFVSLYFFAGLTCKFF